MLADKIREEKTGRKEEKRDGEEGKERKKGGDIYKEGRENLHVKERN